MQRIFLSSKFTDLIKKPVQPISFGIVNENGDHEFYAEISDFDVNRTSDFVKETVLSVLDLEVHGLPEVEVSKKLWDWLIALPWRRDKELQIFVKEQDEWNALVEMLNFRLPYNVIAEPAYLSVELETKSMIRAMVREIKDINNFTKQAVREYALGFLGYHFENKTLPHNALGEARAIREGWLRADRYIEQSS